jgi:hypothetical protein
VGGGVSPLFYTTLLQKKPLPTIGGCYAEYLDEMNGSTEDDILLDNCNIELDSQYSKIMRTKFSIIF